MAIQICPKYQQNSYIWSIDEEQSPLIFGACSCGYNTYEDESKETI